MNRYWLSRGPGVQAEGPFLLGQLRTMFAGGQLTADAQVCREGEQDWFPLHEELDHVVQMERQLQPRVSAGSAVPQQEDYAAVLWRRDQVTAKNCSRAINIMAVIVCLLALIPIIGLVGALAAYGVFFVVGTVLAIVQVVKGQVAGGILNIVGVWLGVPVVMVIMQLMGLGVMADLGKAVRKADQRYEANIPVQGEVLTATGIQAKADEFLGHEAPFAQGKRVWLDEEGQRPIVRARFERSGKEHRWRFRFDPDGEITEVYSDVEGDIYVKQ